MKCENLFFFFKKIRKNIIIFLSAEFAHRVVKIKRSVMTGALRIQISSQNEFYE